MPSLLHRLLRWLAFGTPSVAEARLCQSTPLCGAIREALLRCYFVGRAVRFIRKAKGEVGAGTALPEDEDILIHIYFIFFYYSSARKNGRMVIAPIWKVGSLKGLLVRIQLFPYSSIFRLCRPFASVLLRWAKKLCQQSRA